MRRVAISAAARSHYRPSGRVNLAIFLPGAVVVLAVAAFMAVLLNLAYEAGVYCLMFLPMCAALLMIPPVILVVSWGHCRNRLAGGLLGMIATVVLYLGQYQAGVVHTLGIANVHRLDLLPQFILWRTSTESWFGAGERDRQPARPNNPQQPLFLKITNGLFRFLEFGVVGFLLTVTGVVRTGRVYDEYRRRWTTLRLAALPSGSGPVLANALERGMLQLALVGTPRLTVMQQPYCELAVEHTPLDEDTHTPVVYLSLRELGSPGAFITLNYYGSWVRFLVSQCMVTGQEVISLSSLFPDLKGLAQEDAPELRGAADVFRSCPICGELTDSLKQYRYVSWCVFLLIAATWQPTVYRACPACMRRFIWTRCLICAIPANVLWLLGLLPWGLGLIAASYRPGHSRAVVEGVTPVMSLMEEATEPDLSWGRVWAVLALLLFWLPVIGLAGAALGWWLNRRSPTWTRPASQIALVASALVTVGLTVLILIASMRW